MDQAKKMIRDFRARCCAKMEDGEKNNEEIDQDKKDFLVKYYFYLKEKLNERFAILRELNIPF